MNSGESGKQVRGMFQSVVATEVARAMNLISVEGVQEGEQKRLFGWAVAMATTKHYDERVLGEEQEMEMMERAVTMAMKIIQTCLPRPPLPGKVAQNALMSAFGGVVPLCFSTLDDALKEKCPDYIRAATYVGLVVIAGITFVGLLSKKRAKAALRVVASAAIAAVSTTIVYKVPENVYIKSTCGVLGALATFATMAIDW